MPLRPEEFHARAVAAADADGRLPLPDVAGWDIFPFETDTLRTRPLAPPAPERPRSNEDPATCGFCARRDEGVWLDEHWRVARFPGGGVPLLLFLYPRAHHDLADLPDERARELGLLTVHLARAVEALPHIARAHVTRFGDGGAHLHVGIWARPAGQAQLRGSCLTIWDDVLPPYPAEVSEADAMVVAEALSASYGGMVRS
jgi:diadenosine tetraphosphate (Ap4A) HIT family hydrolase